MSSRIDVALPLHLYSESADILVEDNDGRPITIPAMVGDLERSSRKVLAERLKFLRITGEMSKVQLRLDGSTWRVYLPQNSWPPDPYQLHSCLP